MYCFTVVVFFFVLSRHLETYFNIWVLKEITRGCYTWHRLQNSRIFANASDGLYSNERSGASEKMVRENGERR